MANISKVTAGFALFCSLISGQAMADENRLFISQDNSLNFGSGNTLFVDQSLATDSIVSGALGVETAAQQVGGGNVANIEVTSSRAQVALNQINTGSGIGNTATVDLSGFMATGTVAQNGFGNTGGIDVSGQQSNALLNQVGNRNEGSVNVSGIRATGELVQIGNDNDTSLSVTGSNTAVVFTQNGNNIVSPGVTVATNNGGTIIINRSN